MRFISDHKASLKQRLITGSVGSFSVRVGSVILGLLSSFLLAKYIGSHGYGLYVFALAFVQVLSVVATLGTNKLLVREIAKSLQQKQWSILRGILNWSNRTVLISSIVIMFIVGITSYFIFIHTKSEKSLALLAASFIIPFIALSTLRSAALQGLHRGVISQIPDSILRPVLFIIIVTINYYLFSDTYSGISAVINNLFAAIVAFLVGSYLLIKSLPIEYSNVESEKAVKKWIKLTIPFCFLNIAQVTGSRVDILILGAYVTPSEVGIYSIANNITIFISFFLTSTNAIMAPNIASLHSENNIAKLQKLITYSSVVLLLLSLPIAAIFIIFGEYILLLFGEEFVSGYTILTILTIGQLFNAVMGSVGLMLTMTGYEKDTLKISVIGLILNAVLAFILVPKYGAIGAAISTATYLIVWNTLLGILLYKNLKISPSILGLFIRSKNGKSL